MNKKILAVSLLSVFAFSFVVSGASAETRAEKKVREAAKKVERRVINKMATTTNATSTSSFSSVSSSASSKDAACVRNAVIARENSIVSAFSAFSASMTSAHQTRLNDLSNAWNLSGKERKTAVKNAWNTFKTSSKTVANTLKNSKKSVWSSFEASRKTCKGGDKETGVSEENEGKGIDISS